jgi:hypothetical protein
MIRTGRTLTVLASCFLAAASFEAMADNPERDYRVIVDRNIFGLKPPPPPATNVVVQPQPKEEYFLTGLSSIGGIRAYFMSKASPTKKEPEYYSLGVDDKKDGLEVVSIDLASQSVKVRNSGIESVMTFASHGIKPPAGAPAPGMPGVPGAPGTTPGVRVSALPPGTVPQVAGSARMVAPTAPAGAVGGPVGVGATQLQAPGGTSAILSETAASRVRAIPSRTVRAPNPQTAPIQHNPVSREEEVLMMELQRAANPHINFPPTPMPQ